MELAKIIKKKFKDNVLDAMEFDWGGSVSLIENGKNLNLFSSYIIDPKNKNVFYQFVLFQLLYFYHILQNTKKLYLIIKLE